MTEPLSRPCVAFNGNRQIAAGALIDVALAIRAALADDPRAAVLTFDDATGAVIDLDLRGSTSEVVKRLSDVAEHLARPLPPRPVHPRPERELAAGPGRPHLGVVAREVTLLPRHWEWLASQRGGASATLRRLVDEARRVDGGGTESRRAMDAAYRFMAAMAGDLPGFEEAARALFAGDRERFARETVDWPEDVRSNTRRLAWADAAVGSGVE